MVQRQVFFVRVDDFHSRRRQISKPFHPCCKCIGQKHRKRNSNRLSTFPLFTPVLIAKELVDLRRFFLHIVPVISVCVHIQSEQDQKICEFLSECRQRLKAYTQVEWVNKA